MTSHEMPRWRGSSGIGADEQLAEVGDLRVGRPELVAGDDVVVAIAHRTRTQRREVGSGAGLGEALAPHVFAPEDARQVPGPLLGRALGGDGRTGVQGADEVAAHVRCARPFGLLEEDQLLGGARTASAVLGRPGDACVAGVLQPALPGGVVGTLGGPVVVGRFGFQRGQLLGEPLTHLEPERLLLGRLLKSHLDLPFRFALAGEHSPVRARAGGRSTVPCRHAGSVQRAPPPPRQRDMNVRSR